jgi:hypothetical protein
MRCDTRQKGEVESEWVAAEKLVESSNGQISQAQSTVECEWSARVMSSLAAVLALCSFYPCWTAKLVCELRVADSCTHKSQLLLPFCTALPPRRRHAGSCMCTRTECTSLIAPTCVRVSACERSVEGE